MRKICMVVLSGIGMAVASVAGAQDGAALATSSGCTTCHAVDTKKVGPSYKDIAAKYKGKADAEKTLVDKLASAKGHPAVKAKGDDLTKLVKYILAQ
ncbi:MAG TPA: c-type cytochrome [Casimicrobiaceae bacterium]|nr:c-type cytochrome [Casimicrobiaceae bacterium]